MVVAMPTVEKTEVLELHQDILPLVLCHVDPKVRLSVCALVCKAWKAAATASTTSMQYTCRKQRQANNVLKWLTKHGTNVDSVHFIVSEAAERLCLDCDLKAWSWLKDLRLTGFKLREPLSPLSDKGHALSCPKASSGSLSHSTTATCEHSSMLASLTSLTRLDLDGCAVSDDLASLASLIDLEHLTVSVMTQDPDGISPILFKCLTKLTHLHIGVDAGDSTCEHLSCLTALQELHISKYVVISAASLAGLEQLKDHLTCLRIHSARYIISPVMTPAFSSITNLQHLEIQDCQQLKPAVLQGMTALRHLSITGTALDACGSNPSTARGIPMLLAILPQLQHLTHLTLMDCLSHPQPAEAYAAVTSSQHLESLILRRCNFPRNICRHMFSDAVKLPALKQLLLHCNWPESITLEAGDAARLVHCCPSLQHLDVDLAKQSPEDIQTLTQLTALTQLAVNKPPTGFRDLVGQLPRLRHQEIDRPRDPVVPAWPQLLELTALTYLRFPGAGLCDNRHLSLQGMVIQSKPGPDGSIQPDVSLQVAQLISRPHQPCLPLNDGFVASRTVYRSSFKQAALLQFITDHRRLG